MRDWALGKYRPHEVKDIGLRKLTLPSGMRLSSGTNTGISGVCRCSGCWWNSGGKFEPLLVVLVWAVNTVLFG